MSARTLLAIGSALFVGGLLIAAALLRPRPDSPREAAYVVIPIAGAVALVLAAWGRF